ncbi:uncharacterized protein LOC142527121 [Primulina tabacum]|uniref:uncharacterized protein LOC142527121 n=1 Tax=Primulina tabacum TaxID=48773 RepID=UPI003F5AD18B
MSDTGDSSLSPFSVGARKAEIEDEVFYESLHYLERLQELELLYNYGEVTTPELVAELNQVRKHLNIAVWVDVFKDGHMYQLVLRKELKILRRIAHSHSFLMTGPSSLSVWLKFWIIVVEEKLGGTKLKKWKLQISMKSDITNQMDTSFVSAALRPPVLDGTNYNLWKVKIRYYIKSIDERAWQRVINGWSPLVMLDQEGDNLPKPETDWTADEVQNSNYNAKTLKAIFTSVDMNMFSLITNCTSAKNAWDILQRHCEGSESVRRTRLMMLTSKFEMMTMEESENILDFDRRLREIANEAFSCGDPISNERLVRKVLRSLPERFNIKICAIDEAKDTSQMALEVLISSLRTFEMNLDMLKKDKGKTTALQASNDSYNELLQISQEVDDSDLCEDSISFITKKFGDYLKRIRDKKRMHNHRNFQVFHPLKGHKGFLPSNNFNQGMMARDNLMQGSMIRLRKNKGYNVSLSDEESDEEEKSNDEDNHTSLNALLIERHCLQVNPLGVAPGIATPGRNICEKSICLKSTASGNSSVDDELEDDEEITLESVQKLYEELFEDWTKKNKLNSTLMKENIDRKAVVAKLEVILSKKDLEHGKTKEELHKATETLSKFNSSTSKLEFILLMGRDDKKGLGFKDSVSERGESSKSTVFVKGKADTSPQPQSKSPTKSSPSKRQPAAPILKKKRSGSSRHMTGSREYLTDYVEQKCGRVTYGGGAKGKIVGNGTLNVEGLSKLHNVQGPQTIATK